MPIRNYPFCVVNGGNINPSPLLSIKLINPHTGKSIPTFGLIDTGAFSCSIPAYFAQILGHDLQKGRVLQGSSAGGITTSYLHTSKIEINDLSGELLYTIDQVPLAFTPSLPIILLGVESFLEKFELNIHYPQKSFSIKYPI